MKNSGFKVGFGLVIFLFSLALAYFTVGYLDNHDLFDYWFALALFAGAYVLVGMLVATVFPVSLGFLFSADVLILHILIEYYSEWANVLKLALVGGILVVLYVTALVKFEENDLPQVPAPPVS